MRVVRPALLCALFVLMEIALVGRLEVQETSVGIAIGILAAGAAVVSSRASQSRYVFVVSWIPIVVLIARNVTRDTFIVFGVLLGHLAGQEVHDEIRTIPFEHGGDDPKSAARRALAVAGISTSPNEIVLSIDAATESMQVHVLKAAGGAKYSAQWPL